MWIQVCMCVCYIAVWCVTVYVLFVMCVFVYYYICVCMWIYMSTYAFVCVLILFFHKVQNLLVSPVKRRYVELHPNTTNDFKRTQAAVQDHCFLLLWSSILSSISLQPYTWWRKSSCKKQISCYLCEPHLHTGCRSSQTTSVECQGQKQLTPQGCCLLCPSGHL